MFVVFLSTYLCVSILNRGGGAGGLPALRRRRGYRGAGARGGGAPAAGGTLVERDGDRAVTHRQRGWRLGQVAEHLAASHLISTGNVVLQRLSLMNTKLVYHVQDWFCHCIEHKTNNLGKVRSCSALQSVCNEQQNNNQQLPIKLLSRFVPSFVLVDENNFANI